MKTISQIETLTAKYAAERTALGAALYDLHSDIEALKARVMPKIRAIASRARSAESALREAIEQSPELFERPRTITISGIKVGFQKGKGTLSWQSDERLCAQIERLFPDEIGLLIRTTRAPIKSALAQKSAAELKRLGITVTDTGDQVLIKAADSDVDKRVAAYLSDAAQ